jgi:hypothetical protein
MTNMAYRSMTDEEWPAFLVAEARPAVLATVRRDGRPHAAPIWIDFDDGAVWFNTGARHDQGPQSGPYRRGNDLRARRSTAILLRHGGRDR